MPVDTEGLSSHSRLEFCLALKAARERKGISLAEIADTTKIAASVFAALERNDLRCWPKGLFRRSFFRDYARTIGLPVAEACAEFVRLFPEDEAAALIPSTIGEDHQTEDVRLVLDAAWHGPRASVLSRLLAALIDAGVVITVAVGVAWVAGMDRPAVVAGVAMTYLFLSTALLGESPATWALSKRQSLADALTRGAVGATVAWKRGAALWHSFQNSASPPAEEPETRTWVTDARRVGRAPRMRVRIKVS